MAPLITFYTPTYKRPHGLAECLASVWHQTAVARIEQIVIPDHLGIGIGGMYQRVQDYAPAVHGDYVHLLCDDDTLADATVVEDFGAFVAAHDQPEVVVCRATKGGATWPTCERPELGQIDLSCIITRRDVWLAHTGCYADCYEGDFWHARALWDSGARFVSWPRLFVVGGVSRGAPEVAS